MRVKLAARSTVLNASELSTVGIEFSTGDDGWQYTERNQLSPESNVVDWTLFC